MSQQKFSIPKRKIPLFYPICPICQGGMSTIMSSPHADGYHRRHRCRNIMCDTTVYSLTPYDQGNPEMSHVPFKDRALTDAEVHDRLQWWKEEDKLLEEVTDKIPSSFIRQVSEAYATVPGKRDEAQQFIVATCDAIQEELSKMTASKGE